MPLTGCLPVGLATLVSHESLRAMVSWRCTSVPMLAESVAFGCTEPLTPAVTLRVCVSVSTTVYLPVAADFECQWREWHEQTSSADSHPGLIGRRKEGNHICVSVWVDHDLQGCEL